MEVIEALDDGLKIIVDKPGFSYGRDAILLCDFARAKANERVIDLGCGTGILSIIIQHKTKAELTAVDIQARACELLTRSAALNAQPISVINADMRTLHERTGCECFDAALCNPPYYSGGTQSPDPARRASTHDALCSIEEAAAAVKRLLKNGGRLYMCYPAAGIARCFAALVSCGVEPKRIRCVLSGGAPYLILIEAKKGGGHGVLWEPPTEV